MAARVGAVHRKVEEWAWKLYPSSSRRFFLAVAVASSAFILTTSLAVAGAAHRNAGVVVAAEDRQQVATSITAFRNHLSLADSQVALTFLTDEEMSALSQTRYENDLLEANRALTDAGVVATGEGAEAVATLAEGMLRYAQLVRTARHYPIHSTFSDLVRDQRSGLVSEDGSNDGGAGGETATAENVRIAAEKQLAGAAARGADGTSILVVICVALAILTLVGSAVLVAGRTRRRFHWAFVVAFVLLVALLVMVGPALSSQHRELRAMTRAEIDAYADANAAAFVLFELRDIELDAVASGDPGRVATQFPDDDELVQRLRVDDEDPGNCTAPPETVLCATHAYVASAKGIETRGGEEAVAAALDGSSAITYRTAREIAVSAVARSGSGVAQRLEAAHDANVPPLAPLGLGTAAAGLTMLAGLSRGWEYRK